VDGGEEAGHSRPERKNYALRGRGQHAENRLGDGLAFCGHLPAFVLSNLRNRSSPRGWEDFYTPAVNGSVACASLGRGADGGGWANVRTIISLPLSLVPGNSG